MNSNIRTIKKGDVKQTLYIYNYYIENSFSNFEESKISIYKFNLLIKKTLTNKLPFLVIAINKKILRLAYLSNYRNKSGYKFAFENSIYIHPEFQGKGLGAKLLKKLIQISKTNKKIKNIIAIIGDSENIASIKLHKKTGFNHIGVIKKVGFKKNKWIDSIIMQKKI